MKTKIWNIGDPCPGCGGPLLKAQQPTDAERAAAKDRDNPIPLPPHYDTAPAADVEEHGELYRCPQCGPQIRAKAR